MRHDYPPLSQFKSFSNDLHLDKAYTDMSSMQSNISPLDETERLLSLQVVVALVPGIITIKLLILNLPVESSYMAACMFSPLKNLVTYYMQSK